MMNKFFAINKNTQFSKYFLFIGLFILTFAFQINAQNFIEDDDFESTVVLKWTGSEIDNPRFLNTRYSVFNFKGDDQENFLAFYAKGKVKITYDVKANGSNAGVYIDLIDRDGDTVAMQEVIQAINGGTDRVTQTFEVNGRQLVIMKIKSIAYGSNPGSYSGKLNIKLNYGTLR